MQTMLEQHALMHPITDTLNFWRVKHATHTDGWQWDKPPQAVKYLESLVWLCGCYQLEMSDLSWLSKCQ